MYKRVSIIALLFSIGVMWAQAQTLPTPVIANVLNASVCESVAPLAPANPSFIHPDAEVRYAWGNEPAGTVSRQIIFYDANAPSRALARHVPNVGEVVVSLGLWRENAGTYNWLILFAGADGRTLCRSLPFWLDVRASNALPAGGESVPPPSGAPVVVVCNGRFVVMLAGSPFAGVADLTVIGDTYDGRVQALGTNCGLEIHGNNNNNTIDGSLTGNDYIHLYSGSNVVNAYDGDNTITSHASSCIVMSTNCTNALQNGGRFGNTITTGDGNNSITLGIVSCLGDNCNIGGTLGHSLTTGDGNNSITLGTVSCVGDNCNIGGTLGSTVNGGAGDDSITLGNTTCVGANCNDGGTLGSTVNGGAGDDSITLGNTVCVGDNCNDGGTLGSTVNGGAGDDSITLGDTVCVGLNCNNGGTLGSTVNGGAGDDSITLGDTSGTNGAVNSTLDGGADTDTCVAGMNTTVSNCP